MILYGLIIFIQSSLPPVVREPVFPYADKGAHAAIYAILAILFYRAFKEPSMGRLRAAGWAILASTLYGFSDEIHQAFVPSRTAEMADIMADFLGSVLGVWGFVALFPSFRNTPKPLGKAPFREIPD